MTAKEYRAEKQYKQWGDDHLNKLRSKHGRHNLDAGLKLSGNASNEKGVIGNGDYLFVGKGGKKYIATIHAGKDYIKEDKGQMYL